MLANRPASRGKSADFSKLLIMQSEQRGSEVPLVPRQEQACPRCPALVPSIPRSPRGPFREQLWRAGVGRGLPALCYLQVQAAREFLLGYITLTWEREGWA